MRALFSFNVCGKLIHYLCTSPLFALRTNNNKQRRHNPNRETSPREFIYRKHRCNFARKGNRKCSSIEYARRVVEFVDQCLTLVARLVRSCTITQKWGDAGIFMGRQGEEHSTYSICTVYELCMVCDASHTHKKREREW